MPVVSLENVGGLTRVRRLSRSFGLLMADEAAPTLARELPQDKRNYSSPFKAHRRLGEVAGLEQLDERIIRNGRRTLGIAARQPLVPEPNPRDWEEAVRLSYWHRKLPRDEALQVGETVLHNLINQSFAESSLPIWMVTLPDDEIKAEVCHRAGMVSIGELELYDIPDGVTEPRLLWSV